MVKQYPHILKLSTVQASSTRNAEGDWVTSLPQEGADEIKCRYETADKDKSGFVVSESGTRVEYDAIIYMPLPAPMILIGTAIRILNNGVEIAKGTVKHFHPAQMNARIWM